MPAFKLYIIKVLIKDIFIIKLVSSYIINTEIRKTNYYII